MKDLHAFSYPDVSPSLLAAPKDKIPESIALAERSGVHFIHIDVMDGRFVENVSFGSNFVQTYSKGHSLVNDVHIMIEKPWLFAMSYAEAGADILTFHYEACPQENDVHETIEEIHANGIACGISIKPLTPANVLLPYLDQVELILVMSVEPGKGGQIFLPSALLKLSFLKREIAKLPEAKRPILEVDGGINEITAREAREAGADLLVAGSYLYNHDDFLERVALLKK